MYQLLFTTNVNERKTFAANVPEKEVPFLTETLPTYFGYQHYGVDIYDDKVSAKSNEDYGKFHTKKELLVWLYDNVFKYLLDNIPSFEEWYKKTLDDVIQKNQIENNCMDILYDDYLTGKDTMNVWRKIGFYVWESIQNFNNMHPTKQHLREYIKHAFVNNALNPC